MATYTLPIEAARNRLVTGDSAQQNSDRLASERLARAHGLYQSTLAMTETLRRKGTERNIRATSGRLIKYQTPVISGWVLCEEVVDHMQPTRLRGFSRQYDFDGLLVSDHNLLYKYSGAIPREGSSRFVETGTDAWGNDDQLLLRYDRGERHDHVTECTDIVQLLLEGSLQTTDRRVGSVAAPLTLDDLLAGLVVRHGLRVPSVEIPSTI